MNYLTPHLILSLVLTITSQNSLAQPSNDNLKNATPLTETHYTQDTQAATTEANEVSPSCSANSGGSVWYQYTPSRSQNVTIDTFGSDYNTILSIWTGDQQTQTLTEIACHDDLDMGTHQSILVVPVIADTTYYINLSGVIDSNESTAQAGTLILNLTTPPDNDNLANAITIAEIPTQLTQETTGATLEENEITSNCGMAETSVWYRYTSPLSQIVTFSTVGADYDTILSIWQGEPPTIPSSSSDWTELACNNDAASIDSTDGKPVTYSQLTLPLNADTTYYLNITGLGDRGGNLVLSLDAGEIELPELGEAKAWNSQGKSVKTKAVFNGGIALNGGPYQIQVLQNLFDLVDLLGQIKVDSKHVGKLADLFVYANYKTAAYAPEEYFYTLGPDYFIQSWDEENSSLIALETVTLAKEQRLHIYSGKFLLPGFLKVYFGYRLADGTVVENGTSIDISIKD